MTHPLTDDIAEKIAPDAQWAGDIGDVVFRHSDMRTAYDAGVQACIDWMLAFPSKKGCAHITLERISEMMEQEVLPHKGMLQSTQADKEDNQ